MFERFTDHARRIVVIAQDESRSFNHGYIGTEHLFDALTQVPECAPTQILARLGITPEKVREQIEQLIGRGKEPPTGHIPFTPRAKKVIELALREALRLGHNYISAEHIALALIREGEGVGVQIMIKLGLEPSRYQQLIIQSITGIRTGVEVLADGQVIAMSSTFEAALARAIEKSGGTPLEVTHFRD